MAISFQKRTSGTNNQNYALDDKHAEYPLVPNYMFVACKNATIPQFANRKKSCQFQ